MASIDKIIFKNFFRFKFGATPILIYQMGKVGSSTVYATLKKINTNPVYHIHYLSKREINRIVEKYKKAGLSKPYEHIYHSLEVTDYVKYNHFFKWNIITLVRDPISTKLSHLFHNPRVHHTYLFDENGEVDKVRALEVARKAIMELNPDQDYMSNWLINEFNDYLKFEVFKVPFDKNNGYSVYHHKNKKIAVMQTEKINNVLQNVLIEMGISKHNVEIIQSNENSNKEFSIIYDFVKKELKIPKNRVEEIYNSNFVNHFFTDEFKQTKIELWSE